MTPNERIAELEAIVAQQREQIERLAAYIRDLEARVAKDSHNSNKAPQQRRLEAQDQEPEGEERQEAGRTAGASRRDAPAGGDARRGGRAPAGGV
jgi:uncharacterized coiled-coil protein SlyX